MHSTRRSISPATANVPPFYRLARRLAWLKIKPAKLDLYRAGGVKEYWIVNPLSGEVYIYTFEDRDIADYYVYNSDSQISSSLFHGLKIEVKHLFL